MAIFGSRMKHAWNAFFNLNQAQEFEGRGEVVSYGGRAPDRTRLRYVNEKTIIGSIYTRLAVDTSMVDIRHVRTDDEDRYITDIDSGLNTCLTLEPNIDQDYRHFFRDIATTMFDKGVAAIVPVDTTDNPSITGAFDIKSMRVGYVVGWYPYHVRVDLYNERNGRREQITLEKKFVALVENPFYSVMNEPNSTLQRLIRKLNLLDTVDEQSSSGKLDLIIQLPYVIKSEARREQAKQRRADIENQLKGTQYGIAYTDGTEKITQLNRPAENNLLKQVEYLTALLYSQLGLTQEIMNGTADEKTMLNYNSRTIGPIIDAITAAMKRSFLTKTARSQNQSIMAFRNPFKLVPINEMADIVDKFVRNEVFSANELRQGMGVKPFNDPKADQLRNPNMPQPDPNAVAPTSPVEDPTVVEDAAVQAGIDEMNKQIEGMFTQLGVDESAFS
jgi:hypothetical protein